MAKMQTENLEVTECCEVLIVGAGVAGLSAADYLYRRGIQNIVVLEASDRIGGRIYTTQFGNGSTNLIELGANWIHGAENANAIFSFAKENGLFADDQDIKQYNWTSGCWYTPDGRSIDPALIRLVHRNYKEWEAEPCSESFKCQPACTFEDHIRKRFQELLSVIDPGQRNDAKSVLNCIFSLENLYTGPVHDIPVNLLSLYEELPAGDAVFPGAFSTIIKQLSDGLPIECIKLNTKVTKIRWGTKVVVDCSDGFKFESQYCIVTPSIGYLKRNHKEMFEPKLGSAKTEAIERIGFVHMGKLFLYFEQPFWNQGFGGIKLAWNDSDLETKGLEYWYKSIFAFDEVKNNPNVLLAMHSGPYTTHCETLCDSEILDTCAKLLRQFCGDPTLPPPTRLARKKWCSDPLTLGTYSYTSKSIKSDSFLRLSEPLLNGAVPRVCFAGEATSTEYHSTTHGAMISGVREGKRICDSIAQTIQPN